MPKRAIGDKIEHYHRKIRRLEEKQYRKRIRVIDSSDSEQEQESESQAVDDLIPGLLADEAVEVTEVLNDNPTINPTETEQKDSPVVELDTDILNALGESTEESPKYGSKIHDNLSRLWLPILRKGLAKELKDKLSKEYAIPENCTLLKAPKLNPEISAAISDTVRMRDKRVEAVQDQLGLGITALNRGLSLLLEPDNDKLQAIKMLSDSCRILCDLHSIETKARTKFITTTLDKSFLNVIQDVERDEMLFGNQLSEKIKASKVIEKQGLQIKKPIPTMKGSSGATPQAPASSSSRPRSQVNWMGPPRYPSNRGGRGGAKRGASNNRQPRAPPQPRAAAAHGRQRAPTHL